MYSLRSFSSHLGLSPGSLHRILNKKQTLSVKRAHEVARRLSLSHDEVEYFTLLVQWESSKSEAERVLLRERLARIHPVKQNVHQIEHEKFNLISDWYGLAVLQAIGFVCPPKGKLYLWDDKALAKYLGIQPALISATTRRLVELDLIEESLKPKGFRRKSAPLRMESQARSQAILNYYAGIVTKLQTVIKEESILNRTTGAEVIAFNRKDLPKVEKIFDQAFQAIGKISEKSLENKDLFQSFFCFFQLNQSTERKSPSHDKSETEI
jgi:uncharacterized protein (TIGR02147 family)